MRRLDFCSVGVDRTRVTWVVLQCVPSNDNLLTHNYVTGVTTVALEQLCYFDDC